jgi:hypothetical protein
VAFLGENGTLVVDRQGWEVIPEVSEGELLMEAVPLTKKGEASGLNLHVQNFLECMKSRETPNASIEIGGHIARIAHLGNIALKTGRKVYWDAENGKFFNDDKADAMIKARYRAPWKLPSV